MYNWQLYSDQKKTWKDEAYHSEFFICWYNAMLQEAVDQFLHVVSGIRKAISAQTEASFYCALQRQKSP